MRTSNFNFTPQKWFPHSFEHTALQWVNARAAATEENKKKCIYSCVVATCHSISINYAIRAMDFCHSSDINCGSQPILFHMMTNNTCGRFKWSHICISNDCCTDAQIPLNSLVTFPCSDFSSAFAGHLRTTIHCIDPFKIFWIVLIIGLARVLCAKFAFDARKCAHSPLPIRNTIKTVLARI